ncbi:MAG: hypothetical protein IJS22_06160 [Lachnospiraceae bacterium]|nr:hypothetical protein [Lachnospiraceae bacterium]
MNEAQTIEELCAIVEIQNGIIKRLSARLQMLSALTIEEHREIEKTEKEIESLIGVI